MRSSEVARHYARVLLDTAASSGDDLDALARGLDALAACLDGSPELRKTLASPAIPRPRRAALAGAVAERIAPGSRLSRFVSVMVERERAAHLPASVRAFRAALDAHQGIVEAEVVSARPLDGANRARLGDAIGKALSGRARLRFREDPALLGGLMVRAGNRIYDASVAGELARFLRKHAAGAT